MPAATLITRPPIDRVRVTLCVLASAGLGALFVAVAQTRSIESGLALLVASLALLGFAGFLVVHGGTRIVLTPGQIRVDGRAVGWDELIALTVEERVRVDGAASRVYTLHEGGRRYAFTPAWRDATRVAASLQRGRFDPEAELDRDEVVVLAPDGRVLAGPRSADPALALYVPRARLARWIDRVTATMHADGTASAVDRRTLVARGEAGEVPLMALARSTVRGEESEWGAAVRPHLDGVKRDLDEWRRLQASGDEFEWVRPRLRVQLRVRAAVSDEGGVREDFGPDLCFELVARLAAGEARIGAALVAAWGRPGPELLAIGHANLAAEPVPPMFPPYDGEDEAVMFIGDEFCAARVARLGTLIPLDASRGALVAMPTRVSLAVVPLSSRADADFWADGNMMALVEQLESEDLRRISNAVYWWRRDAGMVKLRVIEAADGRGCLELPEALVRRLGAG